MVVVLYRDNPYPYYCSYCSCCSYFAPTAPAPIIVVIVAARRRRRPRRLVAGGGLLHEPDLDRVTFFEPEETISRGHPRGELVGHAALVRRGAAHDRVEDLEAGEDQLLHHLHNHRQRTEDDQHRQEDHDDRSGLTVGEHRADRGLDDLHAAFERGLERALYFTPPDAGSQLLTSADVFCRKPVANSKGSSAITAM